MNTIKPPLIREHFCSEREIAARVMEELDRSGFAPAGVDPLKDAVVSVFARYCEILTERLNRVPESHHQAFIDMLEAAPAPAVPAQVPLTFKAVESTQGFEAMVPKFTQVSAPAENGSGMVVFETSKDLPLVQAELVRAVAVDTQELVYADVSSMVSATSAAGFTYKSFFTEAIPMERALHIAQRAIIGLPGLTRLRLKIILDPAGELSPNIEVEWGIHSATGFNLLKPELDTTWGLTRSGEVTFTPPEKWLEHTINNETLPWLTCRLKPKNRRTSPIATGSDKYSISIARIELSALARVAAAPIKNAFHGGIPLDVSRDFFPLGERPRFGDVFYAFSESFAAEGTQIELAIKLTNPPGAKDSPIPVVSSKGNPQLRWDCHTTRGWVTLDCVDSTRALTQNGKLAFSVPENATPATINGREGGCIRARMTGGYYAAGDQPVANESLSPMAPPSIAQIQLTSSKEFGPASPERLIVENNFEYTKIGTGPVLPFVLFPSYGEQEIVLYLGLQTPENKTPGPKTPGAELAGRTISFYTAPCDDGKRVFSRETRVPPSAVPRWQARGTAGWFECTVDDLTQGFRNPGIIEVRVPDGISFWNNSALDQQFFWLRIIWGNPGAEAQPPCLRRLLPNTVLASQTMRLENELLGSSNGRPRQVFHALHNPIIGPVTLEVREPGEKENNLLITASDKGLQHDPGSFVISAPAAEAWKRWSEVNDFSASDSHSRDFMVDRLTGSVCFGDGRSGRIPPPGANNICLREYHAGGGMEGNRPAGTITQLHTTVPYVESVINHESSVGGQNKESMDSLRQRATAQLRHRDRAVCTDDYADLARKASPEVAYARCVAARDLLDDPPVGGEVKPGVVSVIIVPYGNCEAPRPQPSFQLVKNVKAFLDNRRPIGVDLIVLGPNYVAIDVVVEISWKKDYSIAGALVECERRLTGFLHPLTGGPDGQGWQFGQMPHASDIYPLLGAIEGLDYIRALQLRSDEERRGLLSTGIFLICSGKHEIRLC